MVIVINIILMTEGGRKFGSRTAGGAARKSRHEGRAQVHHHHQDPHHHHVQTPISKFMKEDDKRVMIGLHSLEKAVKQKAEKDFSVNRVYM